MPIGLSSTSQNIDPQTNKQMAQRLPIEYAKLKAGSSS